MKALSVLTLAGAVALGAGGIGATALPGVAFAQQPAAPQAAPQKPDRPPHARAMPQPGRYIEGRIAFLRTELKITDAQQAQWEKVAEVLRANAKAADQAVERMRSQPRRELSAVDRLEMQAQGAEARAKSAKALADAVKPLYDSFSPEQKKVADELLTRHGPRHVKRMHRG